MAFPLFLPGGPELVIIGVIVLIPIAFLYVLYRVVRKAVRDENSS